MRRIYYYLSFYYKVHEIAFKFDFCPFLTLFFYIKVFLFFFIQQGFDHGFGTSSPVFNF